MQTKKQKCYERFVNGPVGTGERESGCYNETGRRMRVAPMVTCAINSYEHCVGPGEPPFLPLKRRAGQDAEGGIIFFCFPNQPQLISVAELSRAPSMQRSAAASARSSSEPLNRRPAIRAL